MSYGCFANAEKRCAILVSSTGENRRCAVPTDRCKFRKTRVKIATEISKANNRLNSLPENQQQHIADKYYDGVRVWAPKEQPEQTEETTEDIEDGEQV